MNHKIKLELDPKEADLIQQIRKIKFGSVVVVIRKGLPIRIKEGFRDVILGKNFNKFEEKFENGT